MFEDELEEEMERTTEKVVNMSVAPGLCCVSVRNRLLTRLDGSRVEAQTPQGTRIATPSQGGHPMAGPAASGSATPTSPSYAGALKTNPSDWHLEFYLQDVKLDMSETLYGVVHRNKDKLLENNPSAYMGSVFSGPLTLKFRKIDGPPGNGECGRTHFSILAEESAPPYDAPSPASVSSTIPSGLESSTATMKILRLLRVIYNLALDGKEIGAIKQSQMIENVFINNKLTAKLTRQLEETMIIARSVAVVEVISKADRQ